MGLLIRAWPRIVAALTRHPLAIARAVSLGRHLVRPTGAELLSIVVRPEYRGTGLASVLLKEFETQIAEISGAARFYVTAADTQVAALRFYRKTGGIVVKEAELGGLRTLTFVYDGCTAPPDLIPRPWGDTPAGTEKTARL